MTYATLSIQRYGPTVTDAEMELSWTVSERIIDLDHLARAFYPHEAAAWATERGLLVHYVDNEWLRVEIGSKDLAAFAERIDATKELTQRLVKIGDAPGRLVIEAEAY